MDLQIPLLAAKALILLLLFAFVYAVVRRGIGDLRAVPEDETFVPGSSNPMKKRPARHRIISKGIPELVVEGSDIFERDTRFQIGDGTMTIGRSSSSDIALKSDDYVSSRHARITHHADLLYVEDLGSTNGTFVNGRKIVGATPLRSGDTIQIGSTTFRYVE
ncbi:MAG: FHA domain-containing protein [Rubrobacteraceae bacterium]|nr:FHA domain-containing protein [Rubrobacteraceae bacterium]